MIPFRTTAENHGSPIVTLGLILVNAAVFLFQIGLQGQAQRHFIFTYALVPAVYTHPEEALRVGLDPYNFLPLLSNTFMHGGWMHLILNMWTLWLFGGPVENRLGHWRFILLYLASGLAGSLAHFAFNLQSTVPALGASGAIAGMLGAFAYLFPRAKVAVIVPIIIIPLYFHLPSLLYTIGWFALQVFSGLSELGNGAKGGGIAWWAHIGGFVAGGLGAIYIAWRHPRPLGTIAGPRITLRRKRPRQDPPNQPRGPWG